jgi:predicted transcriptional regulator YdeE
MHGDFSKIGRVKDEFKRRLSEIPNAVNPDEFYAPWYNCEVMFTYFYCLQVSSLEQIPEGMMGFSIPAHKYINTEYDGDYPFDPDPYQVLQQYRGKHDIKVVKEAMILEKFMFVNEGREGKLNVTV